ncbi:BamA/TamA family outer membrane protein [Pontibacter sp. SD6]|uniref:BamA/TamA family outer membrane protein n=1 Tax=Pontibacter cellulosilyticus TaxID=1720253 RepID=A0A923SHI1_9BACT|nr:BamA/TamA family outer membrane protein [Pontibacter cellulosilyticus]MBC5991718.1 BamA/TamA family outer membrane protein [Pontibacter cellulosilyticus]
MPTRYLGEEEQLLVSVKPVGLNYVDPVAIQGLYRQEPNRLVLGSAPYLALYNFGKKFYDPPKIQQKIEALEAKRQEKIAEAGKDSVEIAKIRNKYEGKVERLETKLKEGNLLMQIGEPPAIYDSLQMERTIDQIEIYLNSNGFFNSEVSYTKDVKRDKLVYVTINIDEKTPYRYSDFTYTIPDTAIKQIVLRNADRSLLKLGDIYDEDVLTSERDRLYNLLRNRGYYDFARAYINFEVDTTKAGSYAQVNTIIQNPDESSRHKVYTINNVYFKSDIDRFGIPRDTVKFNGINYTAYRHRYSHEILDQKIDIQPGQLYSQLQTTTTQRKLSNLDVFQFNNVLYNKVTSPFDSVYQLNAFINAVPAKKFQETTEVGINFTERKPGPFTSVRLRVRNIFGGAENLDIGVYGGLEGQLALVDTDEEAKTDMIKEFGGNVSITFPVILVPFTNKSLLSDLNPRTRVFTGLSSEERSEYKRLNYQLGLDYIWQRYRNPSQPPVMQYTFSPVNFNIIEVNRVDSTFIRYLERFSNSRSLAESFESALLSFMSFNFIYNTNDFAQTRNARYFRTQVELGGLSQQLGLNLNLGDLRTFQYGRINPDYRRYIPLGGERLFAYRVNAGVAKPLFDSNVLPYDKHFFAGGATSVRAWQSRRLGLGSYFSTTPTEVNGDTILVRNFNAEQPGEVLLEGSAEYRFNMFSFINGAVFVDAGNVWELKKDPAKPGANFEFGRFYKELAVGTGFGIRFDLSVVVLRFDIATKVIDPAEIKGERFVLDNFKFSQIFTRNNQTSLNIGIGYPF